ncbi:MAG: HAD hydrolase-like protein [Clostridia bacterium]|nr:HAD hydrolase-like protein [Clostridia bacterium]
MAYKAVLFDLDGTLLDTLGDLHSAVNFALEKNGYPTRTLAQVRAFVGNGVKKLIERALPEGATEAEIALCLADFTAEYDRHMNVLTRPYDGVVNVLRELKARGVRIAVVSNKYDSAAKALVQAHFGDLIDICFGTLKNVPAKPAPNTANMALAAFGLSAAEAAYVGDSGVDCSTAANANLPFIALSWGFWDRDRLEQAGAKVICDSAEELLERLL